MNLLVYKDSKLNPKTPTHIKTYKGLKNNLLSG